MKRILLVIALILAFSGVVFAAADLFPIKDLSIEYSQGMTMVEGDITNNSGKSYNNIILKLSFYDKNEKLLGATDIVLLDFEKNETATFQDVVMKDLRGAKTYKVRVTASF